jgi:hypothetical protein
MSDPQFKQGEPVTLVIRAEVDAGPLLRFPGHS